MRPITETFQHVPPEDVRRLDPLDADDACRLLQRMNGRADVGGIVTTMREILPSGDDVAGMEPLECLAAMRDLGLFLGSVKRHGLEPVEAVPEAEDVLVQLGARVDMVPRDTVHHYISWSPPDGPRARVYTDDPMESRMKSAAYLSLPQLGGAVDLCGRLRDLEPGSQDFADTAGQLADRLAVLEPAIDIILAHVTPEFFARTMRPYFEDVVVRGRSYLGPAAAHVPLSLVDLALWAADRADAVYEEFWRESALFSLPAWRPLYGSWAAGPSIISRVAEAWRTADGEPSPSLHDATSALARALRSMVVFRGKHLRIARKAYAESVRLYSLGSGGGSIDLLADVLRLSRENALFVRRSLERGPADQHRVPS